MNSMANECVLVVDSNWILRERVAQELRSAGYQVFTADTGEQAFSILRRLQSQIGWLYSRAVLPGLIDGWILADQYHDAYPDRPVVISAQEARFTAHGDIVLREPATAAVAETIRHITGSLQASQATAQTSFSEQRCAA